jgi:hypothetical protein
METTTHESSKLHSANSIEQCIRDCLACYEECMSCISYCLSQGGEHVEQKHLTLMMECAQMCNTSATLMLIKGQISHEHCELCAKVCEACAESCQNLGADDSMMQDCADMCRKCAESCTNMGH